jgi:hypothetical protein
MNTAWLCQAEVNGDDEPAPLLQAGRPTHRWPVSSGPARSAGSVFFCPGTEPRQLDTLGARGRQRISIETTSLLHFIAFSLHNQQAVR